ncbi:hypothetical protein SAMN05880561_101758 [Rhizobium sp. RU33A]|nr:hypothetical protein SAMN05880561_101758 [Rhizobium sp. RU33A]
MIIGKAKTGLLEGQFELRLGRSVHAVALAFIIADGAARDKRVHREFLLRPVQITAGRTTESRRKNNVLSGLNHVHN